VARKTPGLKVRERDFTRRFPARIFGRDVELETRPGVFSHGELDDGTLALSEVANISETSRVLDLGCGCGAIGVGAALANPQGSAVLVDSGARAAQVARRNVERNGADRNAVVILACDLEGLRDGSFDAVLTNPPYFSDFRIAEAFVRDSHRVLAPGGEILLVTKAPQRPAEIIREVFGACEAVTRRGYQVLRARR
jgi:16S rRNA (guanine1207-N2)-methyltransferase